MQFPSEEFVLNIQSTCFYAQRFGSRHALVLSSCSFFTFGTKHQHFQIALFGYMACHRGGVHANKEPISYNSIQEQASPEHHEIRNKIKHGIVLIIP